MANKKYIKTTCIFKSKHCEKPLLIECSDFNYTTNKKDNLVLKLYNVTSVHLGNEDVTSMIHINSDKVMAITHALEGSAQFITG